MKRLSSLREPTPTKDEQSSKCVILVDLHQNPISFKLVHEKIRKMFKNALFYDGKSLMIKIICS